MVGGAAPPQCRRGRADIGVASRTAAGGIRRPAIGYGLYTEEGLPLWYSAKLMRPRTAGLN